MLRRLALVGAVLGLLVVLLVGGIAAREGGYTAPLPPATGATTTATATPSRPGDVGFPSAPATTTPAEQPDLPPSQVVGRVLLIVLSVALLTGGGVLVLSLVRSTTELARRGALTPPRAVGTAVRDALAPAAEQALVTVEQPDAREAVVRSWLLLGEAAAAAGFPLRPAETAAEYADRLTAELGLPDTELERLADLYREARFSQHAVDEVQRAAARDLLRALHHRLARVSP